MAPPMKLIIITFHMHNICKMIFRKKYVFSNDIYTQNTNFSIYLSLITLRCIALFAAFILILLFIYDIFLHDTINFSNFESLPTRTIFDVTSRRSESRLGPRQEFNARSVGGAHPRNWFNYGAVNKKIIGRLAPR